MVSICHLNFERFDETQKTLNTNLNNHGHDGQIELLVADQGSKDQRLFNYIEGLNPAYYRRNSRNEGVASSLNQLAIRAKGEFLVMMGNDILMPVNWIAMAVDHFKRVRRAGIMGYRCTAPIPELSTIDGVQAHFVNDKNNRVFGVWIIHRSVWDAVGAFCEDFCPYGLEDSDYNNRVTLAGYRSFYIPEHNSLHIGEDVGQGSEYRKMKDASLSKNLEIFNKRVSEFWYKGVYEFPPEKKEFI